MKRLSLEELKASKNVVANLESIKGGNTDSCHREPITPQTIKDATIIVIAG